MKPRYMKSKAKEFMKPAIGTLILGCVLYTVLLAVGNIIPVIGCVLIMGTLYVGLQNMFIDASKGGKPEVGDLFEEFKERFGDTFLLGLLVSLYTFLWGLLLIIPGIVKTYSYSMSYYIMGRNKNVSASEAIELSREYMDGNKWRLFVLDLSFILWDLLIIVTCGLAGIYVMPYKMAAKTVFFNDIYEKNNPGAASKSFYNDEVVIDAECSPVDNGEVL